MIFVSMTEFVHFARLYTCSFNKYLLTRGKFNLYDSTLSVSPGSPESVKEN